MSHTSPCDTRSLSVTETARLLNLSQTTVRERIGTGDLEAVRIGRIYRVLTESIWTYRHRQGTK